MPAVPVVLRDLPYFHRRTTIDVRGRPENVGPTQIIVWVSITDIDQDTCGTEVPRLPAILDTGLNHNFAIKQEHLTRWAGIDPRWLSKTKEIKVRDEIVPVYDAEVWLHSNRPGERDTIADQPSFRLGLELGIAVYPRGMSGAPRLPLLGLRALEWSKLRLAVDCERRRVWLGTRRRFWFLV